MRPTALSGYMRYRLALVAWPGTTMGADESSAMGKPLAIDACRQYRRADRGVLHKIALPPYVPYIHLLVDYHFGFTKRALIGAIVSLFTSKVPVWLVFALAARCG